MATTRHVSRPGPASTLALLLASALAGCGGSSADYPTPAVDAPLGVSWSSATGEATFRVWAPAAASASVLFFADATTPAPSAAHPMARDLSGSGAPDAGGWNGVWTATVAGVAEGQLYQYALGATRVLDPYSPSMGQFDSSGPETIGRAAVVDAAALRPLAASGPAEEDWAPFTAPPGFSKREDAVIYEVHVRDFTMGLTSGLSNPRGTYRAFAERLAHVKALGATHVQLLPVLAWYDGDESQREGFEPGLTTTGHNYNWGYDPHSYFAPDGMFSENPTDPRRRVQELQALVNEAHKLGLGVILDVVYNHTPSKAILDPLAPGYYYRSASASNAGADVATERKMARKLIVDSIRHWTSAYRVDGFRFDLMGLVDSRTILDAYAAASAVNPRVLFVGEGWRMGSMPAADDQGQPIRPANQDWMASTDAAAVFSDAFRDVVKGGGLNETDDQNRGFVTLAGTDKTALLRNLRGDPTNFAADVPGDAVQYLTAHDGLTLHDKLAKVLRASAPGLAEAEVFKAARLAHLLQATAQGIAFLHGGCEFGRSKAVAAAMEKATSGNQAGVYYVWDSYDSSDAVNAFDWTLPAGGEGAALSAYVRGLYALRASSDAFRLGSRALAAARVTPLDGTRPNAFAYQLLDVAGTTRFSVFVNAGVGAVTLATGADLTGGTVVVDDDEAGTTAVTAASGFSALGASSVTLAGRSALVIRSTVPPGG